MSNGELPPEDYEFFHELIGKKINVIIRESRFAGTDSDHTEVIIKSIGKKFLKLINCYNGKLILMNIDDISYIETKDKYE